MTTIALSRHSLVRGGLLLALLVLLLVALQLAFRSRADPPVEEAASAFLRAALRLDGAEIREAWEARLRPLTTDRGWAFWQTAIGNGLWVAIETQDYRVESVTVERTEVIKRGETSTGEAMAVVALEATVAYMTGGALGQDTQTYQAVMIRRDGAWLFDGPPWEEE